MPCLGRHLRLHPLASRCWAAFSSRRYCAARPTVDPADALTLIAVTAEKELCVAREYLDERLELERLKKEA
jgi:hypothetical protein